MQKNRFPWSKVDQYSSTKKYKWQLQGQIDFLVKTIFNKPTHQEENPFLQTKMANLSINIWMKKTAGIATSTGTTLSFIQGIRSIEEIYFIELFIHSIINTNIQ